MGSVIVGSKSFIAKVPFDFGLVFVGPSLDLLPCSVRKRKTFDDHLLQARILRKTLGGGMRQIGILCAAGLVALQENVGKLEQDHKKAKALAGNVC